jgi:hypothetical protein
MQKHINVILGNNCNLVFFKSDKINIFDDNMNLVDNLKYRYFHDCHEFLKRRYSENSNIISKLKNIENSDVFKQVIVINPYFCDELNMFYFKNPTDIYLLPNILKHISFVIDNNIEFCLDRDSRKKISRKRKYF